MSRLLPPNAQLLHIDTNQTDRSKGVRPLSPRSPRSSPHAVPVSPSARRAGGLCLKEPVHPEMLGDFYDNDIPCFGMRKDVDVHATSSRVLSPRPASALSPRSPRAHEGELFAITTEMGSGSTRMPRRGRVDIHAYVKANNAPALTPRSKLLYGQPAKHLLAPDSSTPRGASPQNWSNLTSKTNSPISSLGGTPRLVSPRASRPVSPRALRVQDVWETTSNIDYRPFSPREAQSAGWHMGA